MRCKYTKNCLYLTMKSQIILTSSKIYAFACLVVGIAAFTLGDQNAVVLTIAIPAGAGLMANKQYNDRKKCEKSEK